MKLGIEVLLADKKRLKSLQGIESVDRFEPEALGNP